MHLRSCTEHLPKKTSHGETCQNEKAHLASRQVSFNILKKWNFQQIKFSQRLIYPCFQQQGWN
jgi:hypothetical protein